MTLRFVFLFFLSACGSSLLHAQQQARYSQFLFNKQAINPAYTGARGHLTLGALYRHQWTGIDEAPQTISFTAHAPLKNRRLALGGQLVHDRLGLTQSTGIYADYAYRLRTDGGLLSLGAQAGVLHQRLDLTNANPLDGGDPNLQSNAATWQPDAGIGLFFSATSWYAGLSVPQLLEPSFTGIAGLDARQARHYYAMGGYAFKVNPDVTLHPQALLLYAEGASLQAEANFSILVSDHFWTGFGYRSTTTALFNMAYEWTSGLRIGYAYDMILGPLSSQTGGSHELFVGVDIGRQSLRMYTPRQLRSPIF